MKFEVLKEEAKKLVYPRENLSQQCSAGIVACALLTDKGHVYTGINIDTHCGLGFCAEHSAISSMLLYGESRIEKIVAVTEEMVIPPCGRCRELMYQVNHENINTKVLVDDGVVKLLSELLPYLWWEKEQGK